VQLRHRVLGEGVPGGDRQGAFEPETNYVERASWAGRAAVRLVAWHVGRASLVHTQPIGCFHSILICMRTPHWSVFFVLLLAGPSPDLGRRILQDNVWARDVGPRAPRLLAAQQGVV
jgi:hypothetical protein